MASIRDLKRVRKQLDDISDGMDNIKLSILTAMVRAKKEAPQIKELIQNLDEAVEQVSIQGGIAVNCISEEIANREKENNAPTE
jgi:hypothetical protein